jgi:transcriptional regulator with XRE-family HTH domain
MTTLVAMTEGDTVVDGDAPALKRLGAFVKTRREAKGWSQQNLADFLSIGRDVVKRIEAGNSDPRASVVLRLLPVLDASAEDLRKIIYGQIGANRVA